MLGGSGMGPAGGLLVDSELSMSLGSPFPKAAVLTPEQVRADVVSRTAFEGLRREAAVSLAKRDFRVGEPAWIPPGSQEVGAKLERYIGEDSVAEKLPGGGHALLSSTIPLRVNDGSGLAPVSLTLRDDGEAYVPANPLASVAISTHAADGIAFADGLSVAAVSAAGAEAPVVVGNRVLFANAARDSDLLEEPRPSGAAISWQLRSQDSPSDEGLAFRLPAGAVLQRSSSLPGAVEVLVEGKTQLRVRPAAAETADGVSVPVSYSISGDVLTTRVDLSGTVDFPVLVDPEIEVYTFAGFYGTANSAHVWSNWHECNSAGRCKPESCNNYAEFCGEEYSNLIQTGMNPSGSAGTYGKWYIDAPGPQGKAGSAGITRVDLTGVTHRAAGQSEFVSEIGESNGSDPVYSWDGYEGASGPSPLVETGNLTERPIAFCAQAGGGHDGSYPPLCDEELNQGKYFAFSDRLTGSSQTEFNYARVEGATVTYREPAPPNRVVLNHPGYEGQWLKAGPTNWAIEAESEGLGIGKFELEIPAGNSEGAYFKQSVSCDTQNGFAGCPSVATSEAINLSELKQTGVYSLAPVAIGAGGFAARKASSYVSLYLDKEPPVIGELTGSLAQAAGGVIGDGNYILDFDPDDGSTGSPQSGVHTVEISVDGQHAYTDTTTCPTSKGVPAEGCFGLSGSWTMNGQAYGAGPHTITVVAKDWVGNESSKSFVVTVNEAAYEPLGPGAVNIETGDYKLSPTDVSLSGGDTTLSVSRTYDSRKPTQGSTGPLGPLWSLSLPASAAEEEWQSLTPLPQGSVAVYNAHGEELIFTAKEGGGYNAPAGYQSETLTEPSTSPATYQITDTSGDYTKFTQPSSGAPFVPSSVVQASVAGELNKVKYTFTKTTEGITEPTEVLAPEPTEGACTSALVKGCRALTFNYATSTTASGEGPSEWGEYKGRLMKVYFMAWEPSKAEMATIAVAQYAYDTQGRLRAEWDPRTSPALKTTYGYDEALITAVSAPGQQPWLLHYGTLTSDSNPSRLLSLSRPPAETALWNGETVKNTAAPVISGSADTGIKMSATKGTWSGGALAYSYQWEDCNASGGERTTIPGAINPAYTPTPSDQGHHLVAQVTATNAAGSVTAASAPSAAIGESKPTYVSQFGSAGTGNGELNAPRDIEVDSKGDLWIAEEGNERVEEFTEAGEYVKQFGSAGSGNGQFKNPAALAIDAKGNVWVADSGNDRVEEFNEKGEFLKTFGSKGTGNGQFKEDNAIAIDSKGDLWITDGGNDRVEEFNEKGEFIKAFGSKGSGPGEMKFPTGIAIDAHGNLWVTDDENNRVDVFNEKGEYLKEFGSEGSGNGQFHSLSAIDIDSNGDVWVGDAGNARVEEFTEAGEYLSTFGSKGTGNGQFGISMYIATDTKHDLWTTDAQNDRVERWNVPTKPTEGETPPAPEPRWTLDYHVPVSGPEAPQALGPKEVEAWAQKDDATDATAIFPPDEPQSWPASDYKRANIFYLDNANRTVNTASPSGAISTTEYSNLNNVERTLSADNREAALKEASKSAEAAKLLSTEDTYSSEGTELTSTLGPQHTVKLVSGTQVAARKHTQFFYEEGAPSGGPYDLVTKTVEGAEIAGEEEQEKRTVTTSYSGQENLGWKLHAPTSTTTSTGTENLTSTTAYEPSNGEVKETRTPTASGSTTYVSQFGSAGTGNGELNAPRDIEVDSKGDLWIAEEGNERVEEFTEAGEYVKQFGSAGSGNGQFKNPAALAIDAKGNVWVADSGNDRVEEFNEKGEFLKTFGSKGTGNGQFKEDNAIAIDSKGDLWITDGGNDRVEEFNEKGEFIKAFGSKGSGPGEMKFPTGIAIDAHGNLWVTDDENNRVDVFNEKGEYLKEFGSEGSGNGQFHSLSAIDIDSNGDVWVGDAGNARVEEFTEAGEYLSTFGSKGTGNGQFGISMYIATDTKHDLWTTDAQNDRVERWRTLTTFIGNPGAHTTQTIYYTSAANSTYPACGSHPEWANLRCQGQHAAQPESGLPALPVTSYTYNIWDEPLTTTDTVGSTTRTTTLTYDAAGRPLTSTISSSVDKALPTVTDEYSPETGALVKQTASKSGNPAKSVLTSEFNKLGQLTSYTDASGNVTKYEYENEKEYRLTHVIDGEGTPIASTQTYEYNTTTGELTTLKDSAAGTFTASYDVEGNMTTEGYPNGMNANYTYNPVGEPIALEYVKTTHCTSNCTWYTDNVNPSVHGQWLSQTSSSSKENYTYDELGRLTEAQETPTGEDCTARLYAYDEDGNRTSEITRASRSETCATEGGTSQNYAYDTADRLDETGVSYETFGNITSLPAADAGGSTLTNTYYINDTLASQEQNGEKISYTLDPAGRTLEAISSGTTSSTVTSHYQGPGDSPTSTITSTGSWTRNITGINGTLAAIQTNGATPILQLADLHGDIIATASTSETESKLIPANETSEYGVPRTSITAKYSWLGAEQRPTELPTGIINMGARTYIPQLGRFEQTDPQPGGSINAYTYTDDDPVNESDPNGEATYNYQAAETGSAEEGLPEAYGAPGAIKPPPADLQAEAEFAAHSSWDAASLSQAFGSSGNGAYAAKGFYHEWTVAPWVASALGWSIFTYHNVGQSVAGLISIPTWLIQIVDSAAHDRLWGGLDGLAGNLSIAGSEAIDKVEIIAFGSLTGKFWVVVQYERLVYDDE